MNAYPSPAPYGGAGGVVEYAGFWRRFVAAVVDGIILGIAGTIIGLLIGSEGPGSPGSNTAGFIGFILGIAYYVLMESSTRQATLGKMAMGLKVTDMQGGRITPGTALIRYVSKILSAIILFIGYFMAGFTEKKQALHDIIAKTLVVKV
jgi:uncharacterized RDD family membrane protein YckC